MTEKTSPEKRREILDALRRGTVPRRGLGDLAVGLERFERSIDEELDACSKGGGVFKALRGDYGGGKTFFGRWLVERARRRGFATSEVQISETETPLHRLETVYRRLMERLATEAVLSGAFRSIIDSWFFVLESDVADAAGDDPDALTREADLLLEKRLAAVGREAPLFVAALRGYRRALAERKREIAEGLLAWVSGQPNVGMDAKRYAGIKGDIDHFGALSFLQGLLVILRDSGHKGLVIVLDEVETLQRVRGDVREKSLNALRQLVDEIDGGRFPGLYILATGTTAFFEGPQGIQRLEPLAQRLRVDFQTDARFDNPRAPQIRLSSFDLQKLESVGRRVRDLFAESARSKARIEGVADDRYIADLAAAVAGELGGKVGVAPRLFLKKLVADVLDRIDQFEDFDPRRDYKLTMSDADLFPSERAARGGLNPDDIELAT